MLISYQIAKVNPRMKLAVDGNATEELCAFGKEMKSVSQTWVSSKAKCTP